MPIDATSTVSNLINSFTQSITGLTNSAAAESARGWFLGLGQINLSTPTWDLIIFLFFGVSVLFYGFLLEKEKIINLLVSSYLALAVATNLPYLDKLSEIINKTGIFAFQTSAFVLIFVILFILLSKSSILSSFSGLGSGWLQTILFSFLQVGLLLSVILSFLPPAAIENLSVFTRVIFTSDLGRFLWIILPILALIFFGKEGGGGYDFYPPRGRRRWRDLF